jgi:hypothetical protein
MILARRRLSQIDTKDSRTRAEERFLMCYEEAGQVLEASRWAKLARSTHYRWLEEDPTYRPRFQAERMKATRQLEDEAARRPRYGVRKLVLHKGQPGRIEGQLLYEHQYSDRLMEKLLESGDPDRFNRQTVPPLEGDFDNLTEDQIRALLKWLRARIKVAESLKEPKQVDEPTVEATPVSEPAKRPVAKAESDSPYGGDRSRTRWKR